MRYGTDHGGMRQLFVPACRLDLAANAIGSLAERSDVHTGVLPRTRRAGGRAAVPDSRLVFVEIDPVDAEQRLDVAGQQPTMVVCSGTPTVMSMPILRWSTRSTPTLSKVPIGASPTPSVATCDPSTGARILRRLSVARAIAGDHRPACWLADASVSVVEAGDE
jgi:hypothetical protein